MVAMIAVWMMLAVWHRQSISPEPLPAAQGAPSEGRPLVFLFFAAFFLLAGVASYLLVTFANGFIFDFSRPLWTALKVRLYLFNIFVPLLFMLGLGFALAGWLEPHLVRRGLSRQMAFLAPVLGTIFVLQIVGIWVQIWAPLERRVITRRLAAKGIMPAQMAHGLFTGISDPTRSSFKKFGAIEDDIGMLWIDPERLVFFGDVEYFALTRDQILAMDRKADAGSVTLLSGIAHVVLRVRQPDGRERQIRLHPEGVWTMGRKREAMDELAKRISDFLAGAPA